MPSKSERTGSGVRSLGSGRALRAPESDERMAELRDAARRFHVRARIFLDHFDLHQALTGIREAAKARGWGELERDTGMSRALLQSVLDGKSVPRVDAMATILRSLGYTMCFLAADGGTAESGQTTDRRAM